MLMGERKAAGDRMPGRRFGTSSCSDGVSVAIASTRSKNSNCDEDQYYMDRMREILNGFPNTGPPTYPVQILDHLYMGNQRNADNVELLRRYGITHVLNCAGLRRFDFARSPYPKETGIKGFLMISAEDSEDFDMARHFDEAMAFIDRVKKSKGKALVHCNLGVNRSGAIVAAYLMAEQKRTLLEVINYLKVKRFVVLSNKGFRRQLIQFARTRGLLDPIIRCSSETVQDQCFNRTTDQYSQNDRGGGGGGSGGGGGGGGGGRSGSRRGENGRVDGTEGSKRLGGSRGTGDSGEDRVGLRKVVDSIGELGIDGRSGRGSTEVQEEADVRQTQRGMKQETANSVSSKPFNDTPSSVEPIRRYNSKLQDGSWTGDSSGGDAKKGLSSSSAAGASEDVGMRHRLWTLPRYKGRGVGNGGRSPPPPPTVEVIVSEHKEATPVTNTDEGKPQFAASLDAKSRAKTPLRQLEPVYETKSCNDTGPGGSVASGSSRLTAAESMSAKISGFLNLLQPKKPFRSTSYSNVSSSQSPSSSFSSLSPAASAGTDERPSASSGSIQSSSSASGSSTARPLRIYTRSSTDSEIYRTRQSASTAGQFGLPRPASKP